MGGGEEEEGEEEGEREGGSGRGLVVHMKGAERSLDADFKGKLNEKQAKEGKRAPAKLDHDRKQRSRNKNENGGRPADGRYMIYPSSTIIITTTTLTPPPPPSSPPPLMLTANSKSMSLSSFWRIIQIDGALRGRCHGYSKRGGGACFDEAETKTGINGTFGLRNKTEDCMGRGCEDKRGKVESVR